MKGEQPTVLQHGRSLFSSILKMTKDTLPFLDCLLCACVASSFWKNAIPLWIFGQGKKGVGKTETMRALLALGDAEKDPSGRLIKRESFSQRGLISGYKEEGKKEEGQPDKDFSLLPQLDKRTLFIHEFGNVAKMPEHVIDDLGSQFSGVFDADIGYAKQYGTGVRGGKAFFTCFIGAAFIDRFVVRHNVVGSRFLIIRWHTTQKEDRLLTTTAMRSMVKQSTWREELQKYVRERLLPACQMNEEGSPPDRSQLVMANLREDMETTVGDVASLTALLRSLPPTTIYSRNPEIIGVEEMDEEVATRLSKQLLVLGWTRAYLDSRYDWADDDLELVSRVCWDTIPVLGQKVLLALRNGESHQAGPLNDRLNNIGRGRVEAILGQYEALGLLNSRKGSSHVRSWQLTPDTLGLIDKCWGHYEWWPRISLTRRLEEA